MFGVLVLACHIRHFEVGDDKKWSFNSRTNRARNVLAVEDLSLKLNGHQLEPLRSGKVNLKEHS